MKDKFLFVILTCNRFFYFKNCIESIFECVDMDRIEILVCDNKTIEKGFEEYLNYISLKHNITIKRFEDRASNELYRAMEWSIKYAKKNKFDIINFVQDDYQYMYKRDAHLDEVLKIFQENKNIVQVNCNMGWRRKKDGLGKIKRIRVNDVLYGILLDKRPCDNGFTRVSVYDKIGMYPQAAISWGLGPNRYVNKINGEIWFGRECRKNGWYRVLSYLPNSSMMYDCAYVRGDERYGNYFPPSNKYYFKLIEKNGQKKIKKNHDKKQFSYIEDFSIPDGWITETQGKHGTSSVVNKI